jgi:hypothetical protein
MKTAARLFVPAAAILLTAISTCSAQSDGYRFGVGWGYAGNYDCNGPYRFGRQFFGLPIAPTPRIDAPPFFAQFPPVYYSPEIVARPYGVSPYAAPPGIAPVEMGGGGPLHQVNPYFVPPMPSDATVPEEKPDSGPAVPEPSTTWIRNPFYDGERFANHTVAAK